ncbi:MAG TPA: TRAP transporter small permease [Ramlibacter sp.]|uniref:TRAP transporter small permease n=1 Tax=Ramlibacter sp. TaxID=1917967 RepID=UPI002D7E7CAF|nr:TRAP transporter small permease [Ramlibacter sp.]HET8744961.1 TRAP transporter small permease [Ramlibacter sp.]
MNKLLDLLCGLLSGIALFAIMALTFFDVLGRKFASNSIPGSLEMTELLMVVVIFGALPLVSRRGEHVEFDSLDPYLPPWVRRAQWLLVHLLCAAVLLALAWLMWRTGGQFAETGETTAQLQIRKAPFIYGMGVLCGITGLVHLWLLRYPPTARAEGEGAAL